VDEPPAAKPRWRVWTKFAVIGTLAAALLGWAGTWVSHRLTHVVVDDARIDGEVVTISSRASGWITEIPVIEGDEVKAGQVIARVDDRDARLQREVLVARLKAIERQMGVTRAQSGQVAQETTGKYESEANRLAAAQADVALAEANLKQAKLEQDRAAGLYAKEYISALDMDRLRMAFRQAQQARRKAVAEVAAARGTLEAAGGSRKQVAVMRQQIAVLEQQAAEVRAQIERQDVDLDDRTIKAPANGRIVMTFVHKGEHVSAGQRIAMFHDPREIWVQANVKETAIGQLKRGMPAEVRIDAYPGRVFHGKVYRIGQAATSKFALLPDPNPSGNFTKITQRLPVRIQLTDKDLALRPGMMAEVDIAVGNH
jgi:membrane fusion protein (multidrug efflux system)